MYPGLVSKLNLATGKNSVGWAWLGLLSVFVPIIGMVVVLAIVQSKFNEIWREQRALLSGPIGVAPPITNTSLPEQPANARSASADESPLPAVIGTTQTQPKGATMPTWLMVTIPAAGLALGGIAIGCVLLLRNNEHNVPDVPNAGALRSAGTPGAGMSGGLVAVSDGAGKSAAPSVVPARVRPVRVQASTFIKNAGGKSGRPEQAVDGDPKTAWQSQAPSPVGQWIQFEFPPGTVLDRATIATGYDAVSPKYGDLFTLNAHAHTITVIVDERTLDSKTLTEDSRQLELLLQREVTTLRIRFDSVFPGNKWANDLCVSEATFVGRAPVTL